MNRSESRHGQPDNVERGVRVSMEEQAPVAEEKATAGLDMDQIKNTLLNPRAISKQRDSKGRDEVKNLVLEARVKAWATAGNVAENESGKFQNEVRVEELSVKKADELMKLNRRLETITFSLKKFFGKEDKPAVEMQEAIDAIEKETEELSDEAWRLRRELEQLERDREELPDTREMVEAYYKSMETTPLSNQEKREFLRPEVLAELDVDEYIALWRRLNPHYLSHVTRQGFRDHNAMIYHSGGLQEFHEGLKDTLSDKKSLRSMMAHREGLRSMDEESIVAFVEKEVMIAGQPNDADSAKAILSDVLNNSLGSAPAYPDKTAVHFAAQIVSDRYYGGERDNEVFFLYPADVIASQNDFAFNGWDKDLTAPQDETKWNDVFVWPSTLDNAGIPVDSGMVFLPASTLVDPESGSSYESKIVTVDGIESKSMAEDEVQIASFVDWATSLTKESPVMAAYTEYEEALGYNDRRYLERSCIEVARSEISQLGFSETIAGLLTYEVMHNVGAFLQTGKLGYGDGSPEEVAKARLRAVGGNWKKVENGVSSKEYWEGYFDANPDSRPKRVVYYEGDPTDAVHKFQQKNHIGQADVSEQEGKLLGFDDRHVKNMSEDPRARRGYDELVSVAHRIIDERFAT